MKNDGGNLYCNGSSLTHLFICFHPSRPGTSPLVTAEYKSMVQSQPQSGKPVSVVERTKIEKVLTAIKHQNYWRL